MKSFVYIALSVLLVVSCKKTEDRSCFKSTGKITSDFRALDNFSVVVLEDNIKLILTQSTENSATISAGKNLINFIETDVKSDTLFIQNNNKCNNLRSYKRNISINLNVKSLKRVNYYGTEGLESTNTIVSDTLIVESVDGHGKVDLSFEGKYMSTIFHSGTCDVLVSGVVNTSYAYQISNGYTDYSNLMANESHIHSRTVQDCFMYTKNKLSVEIHGSGNVYYNASISSPVVLKKRGSGDLIAQ